MTGAHDLRLALWDVDGTLADSFGHIEAAMSGAFEDAELLYPGRAVMRSVIGLSIDDALDRLAPGAARGARAIVSDRYKARFRELRLAAPEVLFPGVREVLTAMAAEGWLLGVATGKSRRGVDALFDIHGLTALFDVIRTADDGPGKPHPFMAADAAGALGVDPARTVMIGDSIHDMAMARAAGAKALGVVWGAADDPALRAAGAHAVIAAPGETLSAAKNLLKVDARAGA